MRRLTSRDKALAIARAAEAKKAGDVVVLDMEGITLIADYFVICHGQNAIHVRAIADGVEEDLAEKGRCPATGKGMMRPAGCWWTSTTWCCTCSWRPSGNITPSSACGAMRGAWSWRRCPRGDAGAAGGP